MLKILCECGNIESSSNLVKNKIKCTKCYKKLSQQYLVLKQIKKNLLKELATKGKTIYEYRKEVDTYLFAQ
ncbi:MAG: hypothetical protein GF317_23145 [Candidatus Lokiarchaeota archaeon]|nr:hypothetical protein [Candidatus Lokiarchaeota archaeon]